MGASISTIQLGSSEFGALTYMQLVNIATTGNMYEKTALGIPNQKKQIHDETIANATKDQQQKSYLLNRPIYDTKPITRETLREINKAFDLAHQMSMQINHTTTDEKNWFIPIMMSSSQAACNQSIIKPVNKKYGKKRNLNNEPISEHPLDVLQLLIYWEFQQQ